MHRRMIASPLMGLSLLLLGCSGGEDTVEPPEPETTDPEEADPEDADPEGSDAAVACDPAVLAAIDAAIAGQLDAFAADDYGTALGFASAPFQENTDVASFRDLIQQAYPTLIDDATHRSEACQQLESSRARVRVQVTGADGTSDDLLYLMVAEGADRWAIDAAGTLEASDAAVI